MFRLSDSVPDSDWQLGKNDRRNVSLRQIGRGRHRVTEVLGHVNLGWFVQQPLSLRELHRRPAPYVQDN